MGVVEILAIIALCRWVGDQADRKGYSIGCLFQLLAVGLWFGGEFAGWIVAIILMRGLTLLIIPFGLLGAAGGAVVACMIVGILPYKYSSDDNEPEPSLPRRRRRRAPAKPKEEEPTTDFQDKKMLKRAKQHEQYEEWKEALEIYRDLVRRSENEDVVGEAADRIKEVKREMGG